MESEISRVSWLAVGMISLGIFLQIVMVTVYIGLSFRAGVTEDAVDMIANVGASELKEACIEDYQDLPMAAIYTLMTKNYNNVSKLAILDCRGNNFNDINTELTNATNVNKDATQGIIYKVNSKGRWTINGEDGAGYIMNYDVFQAKYLEGRGYLITYKLPDDTYSVQVIIYQ